MAGVGNVVLREITPRDSIEDLTHFLHRGYRSLAEMGFRYFASYQSPEQTLRRIVHATCLLATLNDTLIGTATLYLQAAGGHSRCAWYTQPGVAHFGQFAVEPALRKSGLGSYILGHLQRLAAVNGMRQLGLDTAEGATHLINFYSKRGYRFIEYVQWDVTNYRSMVMSKTLPDAQPT